MGLITIKIPEFVWDNFKIDHNVMKPGGQACVLKGSHSIHGDVAIKRYFQGYCDEEATLLMKNIYHENIVQFIGILVNERSKCIGYIMPYMPNGSLHDVIHNKSQKYSQKEASSWITQICSGLSYLHSNKIIHRDIKPSNVLLGKSYDDVKLSDFETARTLEGILHTLTTGQGTLLYMAPEILKRQTYSISADIYSLSITIWEILYRRIPFGHVSAEIELLSKICDGERPKLKNDLSQETSDMLKRCWHTDTFLRPTMDSVLEFSRNTGFLRMTFENIAESSATAFENLKVVNKDEILEIKKTVTEQNKISDVLEVVDSNLEKKTIILLGGWYGKKLLDNMLVLQDNERKWKQLTIKLPYAIYHHGTQFLNHCLYMFGGRNASKDILTYTYKLSKSLKWEKVADMNEKRWRISNSSVILNDRIWVLGGWNEGALDSVETYDPGTDKWTFMREMNESRGGAAAAVLSGKIFCCGGSDGTPLNSAECYDPSSDVWTLICNMPRVNVACGAVTMDGNLIVIGGWTGGEQLNSVWILDTMDENAEWIEATSMSTSRSFFSIAKIDNKTFVCGGDVKNKAVDDVEIFNGEMWRNGPNLTTPRYYASATTIPIEFAKYLK